MINLNIEGLCNIDRFKWLRNDINLISADVICILNKNITSTDNFSVTSK